MSLEFWPAVQKEKNGKKAAWKWEIEPIPTTINKTKHGQWVSETVSTYENKKNSKFAVYFLRSLSCKELNKYKMFTLENGTENCNLLQGRGEASIWSITHETFTMIFV
jgi:hypothetical protein